MTPYRLGDDGQTIHRGDEMVAMGCSPESAKALVDRLNSAPVRQEDVNLLLWLLAEQRDNVQWWTKWTKRWQREAERLEGELEAARTSLAFWDVMNTGEAL